MVRSWIAKFAGRAVYGTVRKDGLFPLYAGDIVGDVLETVGLSTM